MNDRVFFTEVFHLLRHSIVSSTRSEMLFHHPEYYCRPVKVALQYAYRPYLYMWSWYGTVIRPIVTYASETWVLKETVIQKLFVFEKKILRRIFGPTKENQIWRVKTNEELDKLIKHKNIINYIKAQRLSWFGHVQRMPDTRTVKKIFNWKSLTKRSQERPKYRWEDNIKQDICQLKIQNWIACVQYQGKWKEVVEKAKTFN